MAQPNVNDNPTDQISSEETGLRAVYLRELMENEYICTGEYRVEIPIHADFKISLEFEVVDDYIPLDTGISIQAGKETYSSSDRQELGYNCNK